MKARITLITLGVDDLKKSFAFYQSLGFKSEGILGEDDPEGGVAFFELENIRFALWARKSIAQDAGVPVGEHSVTEFTLAHNVKNEKEVDAVMAEAKKAGAKILKPAGKTFWGGYAGYF